MSYSLRLPPSLQRSPSFSSPVTPVTCDSEKTVADASVPESPVANYEVVSAPERADEIASLLTTASGLGIATWPCPASSARSTDRSRDCEVRKPILLQLAAVGEPVVAVFDLLELGGVPEGVRRVLADPRIPKVAFDLLAVARSLLREFGAEVASGADLLAGAVLAAGYQEHRVKGAYTLREVVKKYIPGNLPQAATWTSSTCALTREQLDEAARNAALCIPLLDALRAAAERQGVIDAWRIENEALPAIVAMEAAGIVIDRERLQTIARTAKDEEEVASIDATRDLGAINLCSPRQVLAAVQARHGTSVASTRKGAVLADAPAAPVLNALLRLRRAKSRRDCALSFLAAVQEDGRVRARFDPLAAPTGRFGCSDPNFLAVPADPEFRGCFRPGDGSLFVIADYNALQLRLVAETTGDAELLRCFSSAIDPHRRTAAFIMGCSMEEVEERSRKLAKAINYGFIFGMGARMFRQYARKTWGLEVAIEQAHQFREGFLSLYSGIREWHRRVEVEADHNGGVRSGSGRFRKLAPEGGRFPYTKALCTPIQATEADGVKRTLALLHPRLREEGAQLVNVVHDELVVETPVAIAERVKNVVVTSMVEGMSAYLPRVPVVVDAVVADTWEQP